MGVTLQTLVLIAVAIACVGAIWLPHLRELGAEQREEGEPVLPLDGEEPPAVTPAPQAPPLA